VPESIRADLEAWWFEVAHADDLARHGERVYPLLLAGETRCGKTSTVCALAKRSGLPVRRLQLGSVVGSFMGETARLMVKALRETVFGPRAIWLIDEIDGVAQTRGGDGAPDKERAHAVATLITEIESVSPTSPVVATTNVAGLIDAAVLSRFTVISWPRWDELQPDDSRAFLGSHGASPDALGGCSSYASAVRLGRAHRIERIKDGLARGARKDNHEQG
jgi:hypothetical protein